MVGVGFGQNFNHNAVVVIIVFIVNILQTLASIVIPRSVLGVVSITRAAVCVFISRMVRIVIHHVRRGN